MFRFLAASLLPALLLAAGRAHAGISDEVEFFEKQVRPVLAQHCYKCHGPEKQKADLRLDSRTAILKGSDAGAVVVPGKPEESLLIKSIRHDGDVKMPEKDEKLDDDQIAALTEWVKAGLPWPASDASKQTAQETAARTHWAFQRVQSPPVPEVRDPQKWAHSEIDRFVLARLEKERLTPSAQTSRRTLIRRASLDLTGLPPTHAEVEAFENDASPDAFAKLVERLLASPHYGERWGRYWLDVARYADTKGYVFQEERRYPFAFTYRDWVIRAFNDDMPYDKFLIRQIAADHLNEGPDSMAALGFLTLGRRFINNIHDIIDDRIDVVSRGTMALTTTCARCHDHKFDPITQSDYYALYGVFASSTEPELKDLPLLPGHMASPEYVAERAKREGIISDYYAQRATELTMIVSVLLQQPVFCAPEIIPTLFESRFFTRKARDELRELRNKLTRVEVSFNGPARAMALVDKPAPVNPRVFLRGSPDRPGPEVPRRFIAMLAGPNPPVFEKGSGRLELAQAIADPANPLTARVIVNRVWAHHFGAGLVRTPSDFGVKGESPTHPELLDWMASRFVADGWSLKKLHRMIMLSSSYQQSSDAPPELFQRDPENRLLARMNRRRLDYEALRDSLLAVTGTLDRTIGGRPVDITSADSPKRRTVYAFIDRQNLPGVFRTFDFASPDATSPQRYVTTVPQQALFMLNSPFLLQQARALVAAPPPARTSDLDDFTAIQRLYRAVLARDAHPDEVRAALAFLDAQKSRIPHADEAPVWAYGFGKYDENARRVTFQTLPHWTGYAWQGGKELPDAKVGWVLVSRDGGHPGGSTEQCAIRRWSAPRAGTISITGTISRPSKDGDGVIATIVSSKRGELKRMAVAPGATVDAQIEQLDVESGETIDFVVAAGGNETSDTFSWSAIIRGGNDEWNAQLAFSGPRPEPPAPLSPWEKYAQVLLATNEFAFVD